MIARTNSHLQLEMSREIPGSFGEAPFEGGDLFQGPPVVSVIVESPSVPVHPALILK